MNRRGFFSRCADLRLPKSLRARPLRNNVSESVANLSVPPVRLCPAESTQCIPFSYLDTWPANGGRSADCGNFKDGNGSERVILDDKGDSDA